MATENLQSIAVASADFYSEPWEVIPVFPGRPMLRGSMQVIWSGLDALTATIELEISNDEINWNCYGGGVPCVLDTIGGADNIIFELVSFTTRYYRLHYVASGVSTGTIVIRTHGIQQRKE